MADMTDLGDMITTIGVFFEDTTVSGTFNYFCAMNARTFSRSRQRREESVVMDCGPGADLEVMSRSGAKDWTISGDASMELETFEYLNGWMEDGGERSVRVVYYTGAKDTLTPYGHISGTAALTQLDAGQSDAEALATASVTIVKAGQSTWTLGAPPAA